jgi:hypothetical protein
MGMTRKTSGRTRASKWLTAVTLGLALGAGSLFVGVEQANAQEILLTGPLAGAPSVRKLRLYRKGRLEIAPTWSFTLLDEYQRQMFLGARLTYNIVDWLGIGAWGGQSLVETPTSLVEKVQTVNEQRLSADRANTPANNLADGNQSIERTLTQINMGPDFKDQLGSIDRIIAPQLTLVPFRGKIAFFQNLYADTDLYIFGGPAFVWTTERADCTACVPVSSTPQPNGAAAVPEQGAAAFPMEERMTLTPTFGAGLTFYINKFLSFSVDWRALPFSRNTGGFDNRGRDPDSKFPDRQINSDDREFKFNQLLTLGIGVHLPTNYKVSE